MRGGGRVFLLLGVLVAAAAAAALYFFTQPTVGPEDPSLSTPTVEPRISIIVARGDIPANTIFSDTETFITTEEIPESQFTDQYFTNRSELLNMVTVRQIQANERISKADVIEGGLSLLIPTALPDQPSRKAVPYQVNTLTGVADQITPGDFVDMIATFTIERFYLRPGLQLDAANQTYSVTFTEDSFVDASTKTLLQNVQVLKILKPRTDEAGTPTPAAPAAPPATNPDGSVAGGNQPELAPSGNTFVPGNWLLVLAVTDQEAEIVSYALQRSSAMTLILRGRNDSTVEDTIGVTLDILVTQFGLPFPQPVPLAPVDATDLTPTPGGP
jgi:pilus assembly protein CpaB